MNRCLRGLITPPTSKSRAPRSNSCREVISVDRNSRGQERLGRVVLLIAEGVRITLLERSRVRNAAVF